MNTASMTARVSLFARAYHAETSPVKVFDDTVARALLTEEEYREMAGYLAGGVGFFDPAFRGTAEEALGHIVNRQLAPSPLGRAAFAERSLERAAALGAGQYLILGAGYDTFAYRQPDWARRLRIFELDHPATAADKRRRLERAGIRPPENLSYVNADFTQADWFSALEGCGAFSRRKITFCSLLGVTYYLPGSAFVALLSALSTLPPGSALVFDYPDDESGKAAADSQTGRQRQLAAAASEAMEAGYAYERMEKLLADHGFLIYEHLTPEEITAQYFSAYNRACPNRPMEAFDHVNYCLAVRNSFC